MPNKVYVIYDVFGKLFRPIFYYSGETAKEVARHHTLTTGEHTAVMALDEGGQPLPASFRTSSK